MLRLLQLELQHLECLLCHKILTIPYALPVRDWLRQHQQNARGLHCGTPWQIERSRMGNTSHYNVNLPQQSKNFPNHKPHTTSLSGAQLPISTLYLSLGDILCKHATQRDFLGMLVLDPTHHLVVVDIKVSLSSSLFLIERLEKVSNSYIFFLT